MRQFFEVWNEELQPNENFAIDESLPLADEAAGTGGYVPVTVFILAPGAFLVLAVLAAIQNKVKINMEKKGKDASKIQSGCGSDCATCGGCGAAAGKGKE